MRIAAAFCLLMGTSPINFGLLGGNGNTLKLEMTTKIKDKQISLVKVRDLLQTFATFPAPILSHCRLPLIGHVQLTVWCSFRIELQGRWRCRGDKDGEGDGDGEGEGDGDGDSEGDEGSMKADGDIELNNVD